MRDLEDYARLWIPGLSAVLAAVPTNYTATLALGGEAQLRVFRAFESSGGTNYLFDETTASNQVAMSRELFAGLVGSGSDILLSGQSNSLEHLLWCGSAKGRADVHLRIADANHDVVADAVAHLELKDIKKMYERWTVGDKGSVAPTNSARLAGEDLSDGEPFHYADPVGTNTSYILHVHGWNMERWEKDRFAETAFKRLYWQGYRGRFGSFRWPTYYDWPITLQTWPLSHFDESELNAWRSGAALQDLLTGLNSSYPGEVRLMAHSMGNVVAGEALRIGSANSNYVHTYVAMQAAIPAHTYDASTTDRSLGLFESGTPNRYAHYWNTNSPAYFVNAGGAARRINFFNQADWALGLWRTDQDSKPSGNHSYLPCCGSDAGGGVFQRGSTELVFPADTYELFSSCVEARCFALGAQRDVGGVFDKARQLDLNGVPYSFGDAHKGHSGQFRSTNMKRAVFWNTLLDEMGLLPQ